MSVLRNREAGRFFAKLREEMDVTQEKLAEECCCSRSLIQRMESGEAMNEEVFEWVLEKTGITDIDYYDLYGNETLERYRLRNEILLNLAGRRLSLAEKRLEEYKKLCSLPCGDARKLNRNSENENRQFIILAERLILAFGGTGWILSRDDWISMIRLTIPGFEPGKMIKRLRLTRTELLLCNAYALQLIWDGEYTEARGMFGEMIKKINKVKMRSVDRSRSVAVMAINLAWCLILQKEFGAAFPLIEQATGHCVECGGVYLLLEILRVRLFMYEKRGDKAGYIRKRSDYLTLYTSVAGLCRIKKVFDEFLNEPPGVFVF